MQLFISEYELWYLSLCKKKKKGRKGKEQNMKSMTTLHDQALEAFVLEFDIK
jgi:hypothetical protein